ncbi:unnamed protein product, partial [Prorocentrum cordatum]
ALLSAVPLLRIRHRCSEGGGEAGGDRAVADAHWNVALLQHQLLDDSRRGQERQELGREALRHLREARDIHARVSGEGAATAAVDAAAGALHRALGEDKLAVDAFKRAVRARQRAHGFAHPETRRAAEQLASAEAAASEALERQEEPGRTETHLEFCVCGGRLCKKGDATHEAVVHDLHTLKTVTVTPWQCPNFVWVAEQCFSWFRGYSRIFSEMSPYRHRLFVLCFVAKDNSMLFAGDADHLGPQARKVAGCGQDAGGDPPGPAPPPPAPSPPSAAPGGGGPRVVAAAAVPPAGARRLSRGGGMVHGGRGAGAGQGSRPSVQGVGSRRRLQADCPWELPSASERSPAKRTRKMRCYGNWHGIEQGFHRCGRYFKRTDRAAPRAPRRSTESIERISLSATRCKQKDSKITAEEGQGKRRVSGQVQWLVSTVQDITEISNRITDAKTHLVDVMFQNIDLSRAAVVALADSIVANIGKNKTTSQAGLNIIFADNGNYKSTRGGGGRAKLTCQLKGLRGEHYRAKHPKRVRPAQQQYGTEDYRYYNKPLGTSAHNNHYYGGKATGVKSHTYDKQTVKSTGEQTIQVRKDQYTPEWAKASAGAAYAFVQGPKRAAEAVGFWIGQAVGLFGLNEALPLERREEEVIIAGTELQRMGIVPRQQHASRMHYKGARLTDEFIDLVVKDSRTPSCTR